MQICSSLWWHTYNTAYCSAGVFENCIPSLSFFEILFGLKWRAKKVEVYRALNWEVASFPREESYELSPLDPWARYLTQGCSKGIALVSPLEDVLDKHSTVCSLLTCICYSMLQKWMARLARLQVQHKEKVAMMSCQKSGKKFQSHLYCHHAVWGWGEFLL